MWSNQQQLCHCLGKNARANNQCDERDHIIVMCMKGDCSVLHVLHTCRGVKWPAGPDLASGAGGVIFSETAPMKLSICSLPELVIFSCKSSFSAAPTQILVSRAVIA